LQKLANTSAAHRNDRHGGPATTYDPQYFRLLEAIEDRHFWFRARNRLIRKLLQPMVAEIGSKCRILEVGCGNGNVLRWLRAACPEGTVVGMELFTEALPFARSRAKCDVVTGDIDRAPFSRSFDIVGAFDVFEHLRDDVGALENVRDMLVPGGKLLLTVPAHRELWSYFDDASHHCRRYEREDLKQKLTKAGFHIQYLTYYMASLYPLILVGRKIATVWSRKHVADGRVHELAARDLRIVPGVNAALSRLLMWECDLVARGRTLPIGASLVAIAAAA
jgi:SAM-dependent methyltransferase